MLLLTTTGTKIQFITGDAGDLEVHYSVMENNAGAITPVGDVPTNITTAATVDVIAAPGSGMQRNVKMLSAFNNDPVTQPLTIQVTDGTDTAILWKGSLLQSECVVLDETGRWTLYDASGNVKAVTFPAATQADMESGSSLIVSVTPGRQHFHPSAVKCWLKAGTAGNILASYNITSLTDTGTGDIAITIATDFSGVDWSCTMSIQRINSTAAEANERVGSIKTASQAAGSVSLDCWDTTATTNVIKDPTTWHMQGCGDQA